MAKRVTGLPSPAAQWMTGFEMARLGLEAQTVIGLRMMGWAGLWAMPSSENLRMVTEKQEAFAKGAMDAMGATLRGGNAAAVLRAGMNPLQRETSRNIKRLSKRAGG